MRRRWIVTVLILLLFTAGGVLVKRCPRTVPFEQCSELYQHYADTEGIEASFIQGYRLNDSLRVDVTLLQATDSAAWQQLMDTMYSNYSQEARDHIMHRKKIRVRAIPKGYLNLPTDTVLLNNDIVVTDVANQTVFIINLTDSNQLYAITRKYLKEIKTSKTTTK
ncbi:MAG: hypothetical protein IKX32_06275 [Bacteroidales bacterium]|nr:hypothetical protein [Bacteroidales bacterium]